MSAKPIKILHVVFSLEPGGLENGVVNVASRLDPAEFRVHVCCLERRGEFAKRLPAASEVTVLDKPPGKSLRTIMKLYELVRRMRPDVVHSHNLGPLIYSCFGTLMGRLAPILQGEHGQLPPVEQSSRRRRQRRFYYRFCQRIHTVSAGLRHHLVEMGFPAEGFNVVLNGVDTERFQPQPGTDARQAFGLPRDALVIGLAGRLVAGKRYAELLEAFGRLAPVFPKLHLLFVGAGPDRKRLMALIENHPNRERIHACGFTPRPEQAYRAMDLLAAPSLYEGLSNAVLEAMACGVPALAHTACGSTEAIESGKNGIVADLATADNLADALDECLADQARLAVMGKAARTTVVNQFALESMVKGYEELYRLTANRQ